MKITVLHRNYSCETGCCGHVIEIDGEEVSGSFEFSHPYGENPIEYAKRLIISELGEAHVADLDWENSRIEDD